MAEKVTVQKMLRVTRVQTTKKDGSALISKKNNAYRVIEAEGFPKGFFVFDAALFDKIHVGDWLNCDVTEGDWPEIKVINANENTAFGGDSSPAQPVGSSGKDDIIVYQNNFVALLNVLANVGCEYSIVSSNKLAWALAWLNVKANHGVQHGKITTERLLEIVQEIVGRPEQAKNPEPTEVPVTDMPEEENPKSDNYVPF